MLTGVAATAIGRSCSSGNKADFKSSSSSNSSSSSSVVVVVVVVVVEYSILDPGIRVAIGVLSWIIILNISINPISVRRVVMTRTIILIYT